MAHPHITAERKVAYLIGAGGTQACISAVGCPIGILMTHLTQELADEIKEVVESEDEFRPLRGFVNEVAIEDTNIEHLITFFDQSPGSLNRRFADELRRIFEYVLKKRLIEVNTELDTDRSSLYAALLDMYNIRGYGESLSGILTLNYDDCIEDAVHQIYDQTENDDLDSARILGAGLVNGWSFLKLHGSFAWEDAWPIVSQPIDSNTRPLWIPPGIHKDKERYPFNRVWGMARDVLDCDVLRVIGCRLDSTDWDLIALLFATHNANTRRNRPNTIEIIDCPTHAMWLKEKYPYLDVRSIFEIDTLDIGTEFVSDFLHGASGGLKSLSQEEKDMLFKNAKDRSENWFRIWLVKMGDRLQYELGADATDTPKGAFRYRLGI